MFSKIVNLFPFILDKHLYKLQPLNTVQQLKSFTNITVIHFLFSNSEETIYRLHNIKFLILSKYYYNRSITIIIIYIYI